MTKIYLSGPMTGYPDYNKAAFADAAFQLRELGFDVVNPHQLPEPVLLPGDEEYNWRQYLARDAERIISDTSIEGVVVLPGWEKSRGSTLECCIAQSIGLKVYKLEAVLKAANDIKAGENKNERN